MKKTISIKCIKHLLFRMQWTLPFIVGNGENINSFWTEAFENEYETFENDDKLAKW